MDHLFNSAEDYVIIYSSNCEEETPADHIKNRRFTDYVEESFPKWSLKRKIENRYPEKSNSDFFIYEK